MAPVQGNTKKRRPRNRLFLGCFGFSSVHDDEDDHDHKVKPVENSKKKTGFLPCFPARKSATKTVPVDTAAAGKEKSLRRKEVHAAKSKLSGGFPASVGGVTPEVDDKTGDDRKANRTMYDEAEEIIVVTSKTSDSPKKASSQNGLAKLSTTERTLSHSSLPAIGGQKLAALPHSVSLPPLNRKKPAADVIHKVNRDTSQEKDVSTGKFDPMVGMSILIVTLVIMLLWGKLCAILCTSMWIYYAPRFRNGSNPSVKKDKTFNNVKKSENSGKIDLDYEEYKKKVVLEGFLERNHRSGPLFS